MSDSLVPELVELEEAIPSKLEIEVTRSCLQRCSHCSVFGAPGEFEGEISDQLIRKTVGDFAQLGGRTLVITGGEPFERGSEFILGLVKQAKSLGLRTRLYTSGYPIDEALASRLAEVGLDIACVSLEGDEEAHDALARTPGSYRRALQAMLLLSTKEIKVVAHFTATASNYQDLEHVADVAHRSGASTLKIFNLIPQGRAEKNMGSLETSEDDLAKLDAAIGRLKENNITEIEYGGEFSKSGSRCSVGRRITVTSTGDVIPCLGLRWDKTRVLGNVKETGLRSIWSSVRFGELRDLNHCLCAEVWG